ncbi:hypothetical protein ACH5RR_028868 [Cinchona calisaya]|uniref:NB-ARC domain-containing protein n=1 Tax=Cinchona calisaya TaxID=153742 RepID=A0ABD2YTB4_9GENT
MAEFISPVVGTLRCLCGNNRLFDPLCRQCHFLKNPRSNLIKLDRKMLWLEALASDVKQNLTEEKLSHGKDPKAEVTLWLDEVEAIRKTIEETHTSFEIGSSKRLIGCFPNYLNRVRVGKGVDEITGVVDELLKQGRRFEETSLVKKVPRSGWIFPESRIIGETLREVVERTWEYVLDRKIGKIGIFGMGGVGKTTVAVEINNRILRDGDAPFESVIWVTATKESNLLKLQKDIANRLGLSFREDDGRRIRAAKLLDALSQKASSFLLIIDDLWESYSLETIGIPDSTRENFCKLLITTRSKRICHKMETDKEIGVAVLSEEEGWGLFREKVGEEVLSSPVIEPVARTVARECGGLPLAIITVGRALRKETDHSRWNLALDELRNSLANDDMEKQVFARLRFSYDRLVDERTKSCFLYCALYPKGHFIDTKELIRYWIWVGFLDTYNFENIKEKNQLGMSILRELKDAGMLESVHQTSDENDYVKMHDLIRDMLIQLMREGRQYMIQAGIGLVLPPADERWHRNLESVSLMRNDISTLNFAPLCPKLLTLLLQYNSLSKEICPNFFEHMEMIRVLDLSFTGITKLPKSFSNLSNNLRALLLQSCWNLKYLPGLTGFSQLMVLDLSYTSIEHMQGGLDSLSNLRHLDLSYAEIPYFSADTLLNYHVLENLLVMCTSPLQVPAASLLYNSHLSILEANFNNFQDFNRYIQYGGWSYLESFKFCIGLSAPNIKIRQNGIVFSNVSFDETINHPWPFGRMNHLVLDSCKQITCLPEYIAVASSQLKSCKVSFCPDMEWIVVTAEWSNFPSLEWLEVDRMSKLRKLCRGIQLQGAFASLRMLRVYDCNNLKVLLPLQLVKHLKRLEEIEIQHCYKIEEIISEREEDEEITEIFSGEVILSTLNKLKLSSLPELKSIINTVVRCDSLSAIEVRNCPKLESLPRFDGSWSLFSSALLRNGNGTWSNPPQRENNLKSVNLSDQFPDVPECSSKREKMIKDDDVGKGKGTS